MPSRKVLVGWVARIGPMMSALMGVQGVQRGSAGRDPGVVPISMEHVTIFRIV